jgi:hypothetical protein
MNDSSIPIQKLRDLSMSCVVYLQYSMAGDIEAVEILNRLFERWRTIPWDDPKFVAFSDEMRGDTRLSPFENGENSSELLRAFAAALVEKNAELSEVVMRSIPVLRFSERDIQNAIETSRKIAAFNSELFYYLENLIELHRQMKGALEMLGADTASYEIPPLPRPPKFL